MRGALSILVFLACWLAAPAQAQAQAQAQPSQPQAVAAPEAIPRTYDWGIIFPVTPAFRDWQDAGDLIDKRNNAIAGKIWLHRDSLRIIATNAGPMFEADLLAYLNGQSGSGVGYARYMLIIACGQPTVTYIKARGTVSVSDGVIRPVSDLVEVHGIWYDFGVVDPICNEAGFRDRFLTRN